MFSVCLASQLLVVVINVFHFPKNYSCGDVNGANCYCSAAGASTSHLLRKTQKLRFEENDPITSVILSFSGKGELPRQSRG